MLPDNNEKYITAREYYRSMEELRKFISEENQKTRDAVHNVKIDMARNLARSADNKEEIDRLRNHADKNDEENRKRSDWRDIFIALATAIGIILSAVLSK